MLDLDTDLSKSNSKKYNYSKNNISYNYIILYYLVTDIISPTSHQ
jgi:hypothetical protein